MKKLRALHLYLGCIFAPMLIFFSVSGIWQTLRLRSPTLTWLSTVHTESALKNGSQLGSLGLRIFVITMAACFVASTVLGVVMALKHGGRKAARGCLYFGTLLPLAMIVTSTLRREHALSRPASQDAIVSKLASAAAAGDSSAVAQLESLYQATARRPATMADRGDKFRPFRAAFDFLGSSAGQDNEHAVEALLRAIRMDDLQGFAVDGLGLAAGQGNQKALEPLLHPVEFHILPSGAIPALQAAADNGNQKAIDALAMWADDPSFQYNVEVALEKSAECAANATAIDALAVIAKGQDDKSKMAISILETASSNHIDRATEVLQQLAGK